MTTDTPTTPLPAVPLSNFGHHPDVSTDFCVEIEYLQGYAYEIRQGMNFMPGWRSQWPFWSRLSAALRFARTVTGLDDIALRAIPSLRALEQYALCNGDLP